MQALSLLARPEPLGIGLQELVDPLLLRFEHAPVESRVHVITQEMVQDEAAEELLAAHVLVGKKASESEFDVGGV